MLAVLGIDIAKDSFQAALVCAGSQRSGSFSNDRQGFKKLSRWLSKREVEQLHACMEATGRYWEELAFYLHEQGHKVSVVNPARIHHYAKSQLARNKTDKLDAEIIARFCQREEPAAWSPPRPEVRELQALTRHLQVLEGNRTQESNRLASGIPSDDVRALLQQHLQFLEGQIAELKERIQEHINKHPTLKQQRDLLESIPGIGDLTAAVLLGENIQSFASARSLAAYAGLNPRLHLSGTSVRGKPTLSKTGNSHIRRALYFPAITAARFNPIICRFCGRLKERGKHNMVVIGAAMRKLLCLAFGVLKSGVPFDPDYATETHPVS